jgi:hypothetical protein
MPHLNESLEPTMQALQSQFLCEITAELEQAQQIGSTPRGTRRIVYFTFSSQ